MAKDKKADKEKPLEKMTATELRDAAKQISEITGAHGMNKPELIAAIKKARGIVEDQVRKSRGSVREIKRKLRKIRALEAAAVDKKDKKMAAVFRKRASRLKKKTRRAAA